MNTTYPQSSQLQNIQPDFEKSALLPAVIQDSVTKQVLMLGYMNAQAWAATQTSGKVNFWSRSRNELWEKGATSGNSLTVVSASIDCDRDSILIQAYPTGPTCHTGQQSCFGNDANSSFLHTLEQVIFERSQANPEDSYTAELIAKGPMKVAQKVGEEGVEVALEGVAGSDERLLSESADLLYHLLVLLSSRKLSLAEVEVILRKRNS